ncbi:unnamed protein product [Sphacelaria rigidula]
MTSQNITRLCVLGERVSGTCFIQSLITENTKLTPVSPYGHKHFYQDINKLRRDNNDDTLFVFISRDLIDWLNSFKNNTFHAEASIRNCKDMSSFLRMEWKCIFDKTSGTPESSSQYGAEMICERDPINGKRFPNVVQMRNSKLWHFLDVHKHVRNYVHVRYEDVREHPESFLASISECFGVSRSKIFYPVDTVRGKGRVPYVKKTYPEMSEEDRTFVIENVDEDLESLLGYLE